MALMMRNKGKRNPVPSKNASTKGATDGNPSHFSTKPAPMSWNSSSHKHTKAC